MSHATRALLSLALLAAAPFAQNRPDPVLQAVEWQDVPVVAGELLVQFRAGTPAALQAQRLLALGAAPLASVAPGLQRIALPAGADLETLRAQCAALAEVEFAQPNVLHAAVGVPDDPKWFQQWHLPKVRAELAWDEYAGDPAAVVAIIDSGVDTDHPDLAAHLAWGLDTWAGDADPDDTEGHGTHCAGIAAALTDNALGVAGAAPGCRFAAYRCGTSTFPSAALVAAINDAVTRGARVLSMSWGSSYNDPAIRAALQAAANQGCLLVAAAGNDGASSPFYPAAHAFVLAVGATNSADARASFSNWGSWVDLAAPGQGIYSTWKGGLYKNLSGTSMACPLVAGAGALLYARLGERSSSHALAVRGALEGTGVPVGSWVAHGRLDMAAAMQALFPAGPPMLGTLEPDEVEALPGATLTLGGDNLSDVTSVLMGGLPADFQLAGDTALIVESPAAPLLGAAQITVSSPLGSASLPFAWVATAPPRLLVPAQAVAGAPFTWSFGGAPGETWFLLLSLHADTFPWSGQQLLSSLACVLFGPLDLAGLGSQTLPLPAGAAGLTFRSQLVTWNGGLTGATPVATTIIP